MGQGGAPNVSSGVYGSQWARARLTATERRLLKKSVNAPGLPGGSLRWVLHADAPPPSRCPRPARGRLTLTAGSRRGDSEEPNHPPGKPGGIPKGGEWLVCSGERKHPRASRGRCALCRKRQVPGPGNRVRTSGSALTDPMPRAVDSGPVSFNRNPSGVRVRASVRAIGGSSSRRAACWRLLRNP